MTITERVDNTRAARRIRDEIEDETGYPCGLYASAIEYNGDQLAGPVSRITIMTPKAAADQSGLAA